GEPCEGPVKVVGMLDEPPSHRIEGRSGRALANAHHVHGSCIAPSHDVASLTGMAAYLSWKVVTGFHLGPIMVRPHGVLIVVGFLAGARLMQRYSRPRGIGDDTLWRILGWSLAGGLAGMRVAWLLGHWREMGSVVDAIAIWHGGMSLVGGLIGAVIVGAFVARRERVAVLPLLDMAAPGLALGIAIGRVSDLIIGDHLGTPTGLPWGFRYIGGVHPLAGAPSLGSVVHPVALYDLILTTLLLVVLLRFLRASRAPGSAIALFTLWYAGGRIFTDFLRTDPRPVLGLTGSQLVSIAAVAVICLLVWRRARGGVGPGAIEPLPARDEFVT
ncbi:MAG TPA: prolipoprotein diacylglyceryl transferase, partial [Actinomycetota bacterium]|nr:prolipoprotein diacylglyceryl transferase [Actinomycetota bacterium]